MVSELITLKIENINLKMEKLQRTANDLMDQRAKLVEDARAEENAPADYLLNTDTRLFQPPG